MRPGQLLSQVTDWDYSPKCGDRQRLFHVRIARKSDQKSRKTDFRMVNVRMDLRYPVHKLHSRLNFALLTSHFRLMRVSFRRQMLFVINVSGYISVQVEDP